MGRSCAGLALLLASGCSSGPTWHHDVQPIVAAQCAPCHSEGGIAPFALTRYQDAYPRRRFIADAVGSGAMPPWLPADGCGSFRQRRRLSDDEKRTLLDWVTAGAAEGAPPAAPPPLPTGPARLAWIDATLDPGAAYTPSAITGDDYHCFLLDPHLDRDRHLIGYEIAPSRADLVHHVNLYTASRDEATGRDGRQAGPGWPCLGGADTTTGQLVASWASGTPATTFPPGTGIPLDDEDVLVLQVHYSLRGLRAAPDLTQVHLQYSTEPVPHPLEIPLVAPPEFTIPPSTTFTATGEATVEDAAVLWGIFPHMHARGRHIRVENSAAGCLVDIPAWSFHWEQYYLYEGAGLPLPAGSTTRISCTWDNPDPTPVRNGTNATDEMCIGFLLVAAP